MSKILFTLVLLSLVVAFFFFFAAKTKDSILVKPLLDQSGKEVCLREISTINSEPEVLDFELPASNRLWSIFVKDLPIEHQVLSSDSEVVLSVLNRSNEDMLVRVRMLDENKTETSIVKPGEEYVLYQGELKLLLSFLNKANLRKENPDEKTVSFWYSFICIGSEVKVEGQLKIQSAESIVMEPPVHLYMHLQPDTL